MIWPTTLPQEVEADGFSETPQSLIIESQPDQGPPKARRRFTTQTPMFGCGITVTKSQIPVFEDFFYNSIASGALEFEWVHPRTGASANVRITNPSYTPRSGEMWRISFQMIVLP